MVASAAPGMPQPKTRIAIGSRMMLMMSAVARITVGIRLSPSARRRLVCVCRQTNITIPPNTMLMKEYAPSRISGGVCIQIKS